MIAFEASIAGMGGIVVRPAPSRALRIRCEPVPTRRVVLLPDWLARTDPSAVEASRLLARDIVDGELETPAGVTAADRGSDDSPEAPQTSQ